MALSLSIARLTMFGKKKKPAAKKGAAKKANPFTKKAAASKKANPFAKKAAAGKKNDRKKPAFLKKKKK